MKDGLETAGIVGAGCLGILILMAIIFAIGVFFWSWIIMLVVGSAKPEWGWGYWHTMFPWGIVAALVSSVLSGGGSTASTRSA